MAHKTPYNRQMKTLSLALKREIKKTETLTTHNNQRITRTQLDHNFTYAQCIQPKLRKQHHLW